MFGFHDKFAVIQDTNTNDQKKCLENYRKMVDFILSKHLIEDPNTPAKFVHAL